MTKLKEKKIIPTIGTGRKKMKKKMSQTTPRTKITYPTMTKITQMRRAGRMKKTLMT